MSDFFTSLDLSGIGSVAWLTLAWVTTISLLALGLIGTLVPFLPGHLLIFIAAISHRLMLGTSSGIEWWTFVILGLMLIASQVLEFLSGAMGTRWFGGSKWGAIGATIGAIVGIFFMPIGLFLGPLIGAFLLEYFCDEKEAKPATVSGVGSVVGTLAGMAIKIAIGLVMTAWFFIDILWI